jgi:hypothetical protein
MNALKLFGLIKSNFMSKFPETSLEAKSLKTDESKNRDYKRIIEAYKIIGSGHYEDVAKFLGLKDFNIVSRRMKEMRKLKLLINTGVKKLTSRQRNAYVHTLSNETQPKVEKKPIETIHSISQEPHSNQLGFNF